MTELIIPEPLAHKAAELSLPVSLASELLRSYAPHAQEAAALRRSTEGAEAPTPAQARENRLTMMRIRTATERTRKALKADTLLRGQAIDGLAAVITLEANQFEREMDEIEKAAERAEAARLAALRKERLDALRPFVPDADAYPVETLLEEVWQHLLESSRLAYEARKAAEAEAEAARAKAAEEARKAAEEAERARQEELAKARAEAAEAKARADAEAKARAEEAARAEAERRAVEAKAKAERERAEKAAAAERAKIEAERRAERERLAKLEAEAQARAEAEARIERERAAEAARRESAPDVEKVSAMADAVRGLEVPTLSKRNADAQAMIGQQIAKFAAWLDGLAAKIGGGL